MIDIKEYGEILKKRAAAEKPRGINSYLQEITWEVCKWVNEPKEFGKWIGITKRTGAGRMKDLLSRVKAKDIHDPKYLMVCVRSPVQK